MVSEDKDLAMTFQMPATRLPDHKYCGPGNSVANRHSLDMVRLRQISIYEAKMHSPLKAGNLRAKLARGSLMLINKEH